MTAAVVVDVVACLRHQVEVVAVGDPSEGVEHVLPPARARDVRHRELGHSRGGCRGGAGAADRRAEAQRLEGVVHRGGGGQPVGVDLDRPVAGGGGRDGAAAHDPGQPGVAGDHPADLDRADALRVGDLQSVPAAGVRDGDPGPQHDSVGERVTGHHAVPERQQGDLRRVGPARRDAPVVRRCQGRLGRRAGQPQRAGGGAGQASHGDGLEEIPAVRGGAPGSGGFCWIRVGKSEARQPVRPVVRLTG